MSPEIGRGVLDGAWWPHSRDLQIELADLVNHLPGANGRVAGAVYSRPDWLPAPRRIKVASGVIEAGTDPRDDTHLILLGLSSGKTLRLMVVQADSEPALAMSVMRTAASPTNIHSAQTILDDAQDWHGDESPDTLWIDEGNSWWDPHPTSPSERVRR